jgi:hypothetical protein
MIVLAGCAFGIDEDVTGFFELEFDQRGRF